MATRTWKADFAAAPHQRTHTFPTEGLYIVTVTMRDGTTGETLTRQAPISVIPRPDVAAIWDSFRATLGRGDIDGALRFVADGRASATAACCWTSASPCRPWRPPSGR